MLPQVTSGQEPIDVAVVKGHNYFENTMKAVELLGGMSRFVPAGSSVAILPNPQSYNPGTYTKPEIVRAAIQMCKAAGAIKIACLGSLPLRYWQNTGIKKVIDSEGIDLVIANQNDESLFQNVSIPRGKTLKEARVMKNYQDYDILLDMNISKGHSGNDMSGALKNLMGLISPVSCQFFHKRHWTLLMDDREHLGQCIADLNTIIHPQLCLNDSTEFIITNGPHGPGKLRKPQRVVAGTDRVAVDAYSATLFGYDPYDILSLVQAHEQGLGEIDLEKVKIREITI
jgi:uncharacterized protein (DUF362 family)